MQLCVRFCLFLVCCSCVWVPMHGRTDEHPGEECWSKYECTDDGDTPCDGCGGPEWCVQYVLCSGFPPSFFLLLLLLSFFLFHFFFFLLLKMRFSFDYENTRSCVSVKRATVAELLPYCSVILAHGWSCWLFITFFYLLIGTSWHIFTCSYM